MNEAFRLLFDELHSGVVWAQRSGLVRYANKAAVQLTPCMLGQPLLDPTADRALRDAGKGLLQLPYRFELKTPEQNADVVRAVVLPAPVGNDLMLVLNNTSEARWYEQALTNMSRYLQAEMALPLLQLSRDLKALPAGLETPLRPPPAPQTPQAPVAKVAEDARTLAMKLGRVNEMIDVFGASAMRTDERVVINQLVQGALETVATLCDERNVRVVPQGLDVDLTLYGSPHWLTRALGEFLHHCVASAQGGSSIELSLQATGTRVLLRSRNAGLFVSAHARRAAQVPFGVGDSPKQSQPRIGLALANRIIEQHGGMVRTEDTDGSVDFVMELPLGAPAEQAQADAASAGIALEQAQRYAHDMARLMERQMQRREQALKSAPD